MQLRFLKYSLLAVLITACNEPVIFDQNQTSKKIASFDLKGKWTLNVGARNITPQPYYLNITTSNDTEAGGTCETIYGSTVLKGLAIISLHEKGMTITCEMFNPKARFVFEAKTPSSEDYFEGIYKAVVQKNDAVFVAIKEK